MFDNVCYKKSKTDALLLETMLENHPEVMQILKIFPKKFCEFGPRSQSYKTFFFSKRRFFLFFFVKLE